MGAAMRIGPVATLWPPGRPYELVPWVQRVSEVTTTSQLAKDAAAMFASHIYAATNNWCGSPLSDMYPSMEDKTHWNLLQQALHILEMRGEQALLEFAEDTGLSNKKLSCAANGFALTGIPWVIGTVRKLASGHFSSVLTEVCRSGGDTDTVAAMAACFHAVNQWEPGDKPTGHIPEWMVLGLQGQEHILAPETWHPVGSEEPLTLAERDHRRDLQSAGSVGRL
jgi:ADP-ribosylglycohydrolase